MNVAQDPIVLSCTDFSFGGPEGVTFEHAVAAVASIGFNHVDVSIRSRIPLTTPHQIAADPVRLAAERRATLETLGLTVTDVFSLMEEGYETAPAPFEPVAIFAKGLGAPGVTVSADAGLAATDTGRRQRIVATLRDRVELAAKHGLKLSIEPHGGSIVNSPEIAMEFLHEVPGLMLTVDYSHFVLAAIPIADIHPLLDYARVVQLRQARPGVVQCALADGTIDFEEIVNEVRKRSYAGPLSSEYVWRPVLPADEIDIATETIALKDRLETALGRSTQPTKSA